MKLSEYNKKRDFTKTAEPKGKVKKGGKKLRFVVQKHDASHLHYDFRLEIDGVLVSWAVPKGPSADTSVKRLAMHVEDHPMDYIDFEGTIPKGQYGGGTVMVWDTGTYLAEGSDNATESEKILKKQHAEGNIKVVLNGDKLKGSYHLVHMKGKDKEWLLMKGKDEFATKKDFDQHSVLTGRTLNQIEKDKDSDTWESSPKKNKKNSTDNILKEPDNSNTVFSADDVSNAKKLKSFPKDWRPQLATLTNEVFDNDEWIFENKFDGYRALIEIKKRKVNLVSRNGISFNKKYPELAEAFSIIKEDVILDGEIVVEDSKGKSHFQWLQYYHDEPDRGTLKCYVFDILYFNGYDLTGLELLNRKKILKALLPKSDVIIYSEHTIGKGTKALKEAQKRKSEGLIAKKADSRYHLDKRSSDWLKIKVTNEQEMVIGGYTEPQGSRKGFGSLLLGYYDRDKLIYAGKVGTGFNDDLLMELHTQLEKIERKTSPFSGENSEKNVHWVTPTLVAQIKYSEWTESGSLRHPVFLALRNDKDAKDVVRETNKNINPDKKTTLKKKKDTDTDKVEFTNTDKIFWPKEKITKGDVIEYYKEMAQYILPFIIDRPQSLRRNPNGIKDQGFFQKDVSGAVPNWIKTRKLKSKSTGETIEYLICQDTETLLFMVNWGCIEINPWSSRLGSLNNPDYIIFDLDPNEASIKDLVTTAKKVKEILESIGIKGYLKTSGGKGLHVFIPVLPKYTYNQTRDFSHIISQHVHKALPDITSLERSPSKRKGKIYLDYLQNGKGKTMACAYSLRPREGATVSTPLDWNELTNKLDLKGYNINTIRERIEKKGDLWKDFFDNAIDLKSVLDKLN
ncbi:DNA ligase D [Flavobacterium alkalisoli]|uniref:DNA ligase D n=1 Tax=Flavobacterium alkalisoli TaxID=2602769 RepID=UPI003A907534